MRVRAAGGCRRRPAQRIALAQDAAFSFTYPHICWPGGARRGPKSGRSRRWPTSRPTRAPTWSGCPAAIPELHAGALAAATAFRDGLRRHAETRPVHGECGGYMALGTALVDKAGTRHAMAGLLGLVSSYEKRKFHLGYRRAICRPRCPATPPGAALRGHEFHYSTILEQPDAPLAHVTNADGNPVPETGASRATSPAPSST